MSDERPIRRELVRNTLAVLSVLALIGGCFWILRPFLPALLWSSSIVIATWPLFVRLQRRLWNRRWLALTAMTLMLLVLLLVPMGVALASIIEHSGEIASFAKSVSERELPPPPSWVATIPLVGERLATSWSETAASGTKGVLARLAPYADRLTGWLISKIGNLGALLVQFFLTVLMSAILFAKGDVAAAEARRVACRLAGEQGEGVIVLMAQTVRGIAVGVVGTALVQAILGGVGLAVAGVPSVGLLTAIMIVFGIAQLGPAPVLLAAVVWLYWRGSPGWATGLLVWTLVVGTLDNVIRPMLIRTGADLPFVLVFVGVMGGLISLGVVGLFVGPVVLAVAYKLLETWVSEGENLPETPAAPASPAA